MGYCVSMTQVGYTLQAALFAGEADLVITRVEVGSGTRPANVTPEEMTDLIVPEAAATSTTPMRNGRDIYLTVEYRSDLNEGLEKAFQIREFGVFAMGVEGQEILFLYGDLSDHPEPAVPQGTNGGCVRRYPVVITVGPGANVELKYPAGAWVTHEELEQAGRAAAQEEIRLHDADLSAHSSGRHMIASRPRDPSKPTYGLDESDGENRPEMMLRVGGCTNGAEIPNDLQGGELFV